MNPDPLGPLPLYPTFLLVSCLAGTTATFCLAVRSGLPTRRLAAMLVLTTAAALVGAKLYGIVERGGGFHGLGWEIGAGYRYPGAVFAVLVALPLLRRAMLPDVSLLALGDCVVAGVGVPIALFRIGCFLAGCCFGVPSSLPWAVEFPPGSPAWGAQLRAGLIDGYAVASLPVHPLELYFALAALGVMAFLLWFRPRQRYDGQLILVFFVLDGTAKFLLEFLRFDYAAHLQWMAIVPAAVAGVTLLVVRAVHRRGERTLLAEALGR
jgi:phosphatidylglycerol---prolipoprotein diacylglyceryl transferase